VYIKDVAGRTVSHNSLSNTRSLSISTSELSPGLYFYSIVSGGREVQAGRFIAQ
jgi:hypothetical protein